MWLTTCEVATSFDNLTVSSGLRRLIRLARASGQVESISTAIRKNKSITNYSERHWIRQKRDPYCLGLPNWEAIRMANHSSEITSVPNIPNYGEAAYEFCVTGSESKLNRIWSSGSEQTLFKRAPLQVAERTLAVFHRTRIAHVHWNPL